MGSMPPVPVKMVCLGWPDSGEAASSVLEAASEMGAETDFIFNQIDIIGGGLDHGSIDWRTCLGTAHWLLVSSSDVLGDEEMRGAWGASMAFAELEGSKTAMIVSVPDDPDRMAEAWGRVIERIRQIHLLFLTPDAIEAVARIEETEPEWILGEVRDRGMVPLVCSFDPSEMVARVAHSLGEEVVEIESEMDFDRWLAGFLCGLPLSGPGESGIEGAAKSVGHDRTSIGHST